MNAEQSYNGGENFDLRDVLLQRRHVPLVDRTARFMEFLRGLEERREMLCMRCISSAADRVVTVQDPDSGIQRTMVMFGSNNYLGLASHPSVCARAHRALDQFGAGVGGPPLLNGYTILHRALEERLAALKGTEDALLFASGYAANVGLVSAVMGRRDTVYYDAYSHASFCDGIRLAGVRAHRFAHNDPADLARLLETTPPAARGDTYVAVEGVYSMDGDIAPLKELLALCRSAGAILIVDDAHGTGVLGARGSGTAEQCGVEGLVPITMGTLSKTFAVTGGFIAGSKALIAYLRFFARSYMFSASLTPAALASVLAGLDVLAEEPERLWALRQNVAYAAAGLRSLGFDVHPQSAIIPLRVPAGMDIRRASRMFHDEGIFVNSIEYPAVPVDQQRFRISIMATHTGHDIDRLLGAVAHVWAACRPAEEGQHAPPHAHAA